jgi:hypothetical protein
MKGINIFTANVIKDFSGISMTVSSAVKERQQENKKIFSLKVFEMMPSGTPKFQIAF